eukprot:CAMPEP_0197271836 /NCGR_PEP_ID=MMETSP1432-20130617/9034_1 /TAXON_ID=44447 /ORGANISM="Pseudo-nitzschia delicatissima, Strain UNC1205" /LENGTH=590 /DNA_ID=CAMNT_0042737297 /DNA_START=89 /DNA_END=1861 /DNA_ORIENTATION=-
MEATESPTKMEVEPTVGETKDAPEENPAPPVAAVPEVAAEPKDVAPEKSPAVTTVEASADVKKEEAVVQSGSPATKPVVPLMAGKPATAEESTETTSPAKPVTESATAVVSSSAVKPQKPKPSPTGSVKAAKTATAKVPKAALAKPPKTAAAAKIVAAAKSLKKGARKKRKTAGLEEVEEKGGALPKAKKAKRKKDEVGKEKLKTEKVKKARKPTKKASGSSGSSGGHPFADHLNALPGLSAAQMAVQEQMRKALEEDQYSANGSILDTDSDDDEHQYMYKGQSIRLDRAHLLQAAKKCGCFFGDSGGAGLILAGKKDGDIVDDNNDEEGILNEDGSTNNSTSGSKKKLSKNKKKGRNQYTKEKSTTSTNSSCFRIDDKPKGFADAGKPKNMGLLDKGVDMERDEGSIFGQTTGASNSTWVECDKCKKWRRLRGVVDHSKLPKKWYCSMNRNDPERARCSAPEEEYDAPHTPESAADARTRKHLRVWVRRLQCNEQYESRLPTLTRGKKRSVACTSKEPHEWIRCCNPSCGKWRAILRIMDAKQNVIDRTSDGEWYCVMNTWDEKTASCAAPQENIPAVGCPPWVLQDEN